MRGVYNNRKTLKSIRMKKGMTVEHASFIIGLPTDTMVLYEQDSTDISVSDAQRIVALYEEDFDDVFFGLTTN